MGYYRRARHLHEAARTIREKFGGRFPRNYQQARILPGIGDYTARAILSIAFNQPYALLDGNVARVMARLRALRGSLGQLPFRRAVQSEIEGLLSRRAPGKLNQSLMQLGQTICLPRAPRCPACPLRAWCRAYQLGKPESYPAPRPRRAGEAHHLAAAVIRRGSKVALVRGLGEGLLEDLWNFPAAFGSSRPQALRRLEEKLHALVPGSAVTRQPAGQLRHQITYRAIHVQVYPAEAPPGAAADSLRWLSTSRLPQAAISQLARKIAKEIRSLNHSIAQRQRRRAW
jgi:A/G-specific adenine glycosylase